MTLQCNEKIWFTPNNTKYHRPRVSQPNENLREILLHFAQNQLHQRARVEVVRDQSTLKSRRAKTSTNFPSVLKGETANVLACDTKNIYIPKMAHLKVLTPNSSSLSDLLGPLPTEEESSDITLEDPTEALTRASLRKRVEEEVRLTTQNNILLPPNLLDQVADHVLFFAKDEPCGLRGCILTVLWDEGENGQQQQLAQVKADANTPTTHILGLTLRPDPTSWYTKMARIFRSLGKRRMVVSCQYDLTKRRLYNFEE